MRLVSRLCLLLLSLNSLTFAATITGKLPMVSGVSSALVSISNLSYIYTTKPDTSGNFTFLNVNGGVYSLETQLNGYNQSQSVTIDASTAVNVTVPNVALVSAVSTSNSYSYSWAQDPSFAGLPSEEIQQNVVKPPQVTILGKAYTILDVNYAQELFNRFGIVLSNEGDVWTQEYAFRLYTILNSIPQNIGNDYQYNSALTPTRWILTPDNILNDIDIGTGNLSGVVRVSEPAFTYAQPFVAEINGVKGLYFSKRLHAALVRFVTNNGTNQDAVIKILNDRYGLTIDSAKNPLNYSQFTNEPASRFQSWFLHPDELVQIINNFETLPAGFAKIVGFKWLVRRLDGTVNPAYPSSAAIAWGDGHMEFMDIAFSNFDSTYITRLILHEKAHYIYQNILSTSFKKQWADLGGWQYSLNPTNPNYDDTYNWQTTKTTEFVSAYGHGKNPNEDFAESVAYFVNDPASLQARAIEKYNFIRDNVMLGNSYVSVIRPDLTFTILNLFPSYTYPGMIKSMSTKVVGDPTADKTVTIHVELTSLPAGSNPATSISGRMFGGVNPQSPFAPYVDVWLSPVNGSSTVFEGSYTFSKYARNGYWTLPNLTIHDSIGLERYESSLLYGFKCYLNSPLEDTIPPQVQKGTSTLSIRNDVYQGHNVQIATLKFNVIENTGLLFAHANLVTPGSYPIEVYGDQNTDGDGPRTIDFLIKDYAPSGRYTINQIMMKDYGLNLNYTYYNTYGGSNSDGTSIVQDEPSPFLNIVTPNPDTKPPELDLNRISITATPTNTTSPDGETLVTLKFYARDDISGLGNPCNFTLRDPQGGEHSYTIYHPNFYTDYFAGDPTAWTLYTWQELLPRGSLPGTWGLLSMSLGDKAGNGQAYSFLETLQFDPNSTSANDLNIIGDPVGGTFQTGSTINLTVTATGGSNVSYEWFKDGISLLSNTTKSITNLGKITSKYKVDISTNITGASTPKLILSNTQKSDSGTYYCIVTNNAGRVVSSAALVSVNDIVTPVITTQPKTQTVNIASTATLSVTVTGTSPTYQWYLNNLPISGATSMTYSIANAQASNAGLYTVVVTNAAGTVISQAAQLTVVSPIAISTQPQSKSVLPGTSVSLSVTATGTSPTYQWYLNNVAIPGATSSIYNIPSALVSNNGTYTVTVSNSAGTVTSQAAQLYVVNPGRLTNLSVLSLDGPGSQLLTIGFVSGGAGVSGSQNLLIRASGPAIGVAPFGVPNVLPDPTLTVFNSSTAAVASNDNWGTPASNATAVIAADTATGAFALTSTTSLDAAVVNSLNAGSYTVQVSGKNGASGIVIAEVYDNTPANSYTISTPRLVNISCLEQVASGGVLTAGFVIGGTTPEQVLIRASGPTLAAAPFNLTGTIADPKLTVFNSSSTVLATNTGWGGSTAITAANKSTGAFQFVNNTSKDSAVLLTLQPGAYTVQATSASGTAGVTLIEVYEVPSN